MGDPEVVEEEALDLPLPALAHPCVTPSGKVRDAEHLPPATLSASRRAGRLGRTLLFLSSFTAKMLMRCVRPGVLLVTAIFWPVREFRRLDFPTLLLPTNATSGNFVVGGLASKEPRNFTPFAIVLGSNASMNLLHDAESSSAGSFLGTCFCRLGPAPLPAGGPLWPR